MAPVRHVGHDRGAGMAGADGGGVGADDVPRSGEASVGRATSTGSTATWSGAPSCGQGRQHGGRIDAGEDPAVDRGAGELGQRIVGMAALEPGGDAAGAGQADLGRSRLDDVGRRRRHWGWRASGGWRRRAAARRSRSAVGEHGAGGVVEHRLEAVMLEPVEGVGERVDRIVRARPRAVAARIGRGQSEALIDLLGGLHARSPERSPSARKPPPPPSALSAKSIVAGSNHWLEREIGAVAAGLLVAGEQDEDVAVGLEALGA